MPAAARILDPTSHSWLISAPVVPVGSGIPVVTIGGQIAAAVGDIHACAFPPPAGPHPSNTIAKGSTTVTIGGRPAARVGDLTACGAAIVSGAFNVMIGG
ncbi:MAG: PAAR domain-containing protein [Gammaproteobacteria bacterium]